MRNIAKKLLTRWSNRTAYICTHCFWVGYNPKPKWPNGTGPFCPECGYCVQTVKKEQS